MDPMGLMGLMDPMARMGCEARRNRIKLLPVAVIAGSRGRATSTRRPVNLG
jgi:hypothetical protein